MKNKIFHLFLLFAFFSCADLCFGNELTSGVWSGVGEGAHGDNGALIIGVNKITNELTGYYEASDTTSNGTNECQIFIHGVIKNSALINLVISDAHKNSFSIKPKVIKGKILFQKKADKYLATLYLDEKPWSCTWLYDGLPSYVPPANFNIKDGLPFSLLRNENYVAVNVIGEKRAYFFNEPNESSVRKAFLVAGDLIYVNEERVSWYYVKFQGKKKETLGWIKKSDTIQFEH